MTERSSTKIAPASVPTLSPQGPQAGKPAMPLGRPFTLIGARNRAHLHLLSSTVSRNHACIISTDNGLYIRDLGSRTGVMVNGRRVKETDLRDGDSLQIGSFQFKFGDPAGPVRFPLTPKAASAMLEMAGTQTRIDTRTLLVGRRSTADITLGDSSVSNTHALIFEVNGQRFIRDLGSRTGTIVNGKPVNHQLLELGDEIKIGETIFHYVSASIAETPAAVEEPELELEEEPIGIDFSTGEGQPAEPLIPLENEEPLPLDKIPLDDSESGPLTVPPSAPRAQDAGTPPEETPAASAKSSPAEFEPESAPVEPPEPVEDLGLEFEASAPPPQTLEPPTEPISVPVSDAAELNEPTEDLTPLNLSEAEPLPAEPEASPLQLDVGSPEVEPEPSTSQADTAHAVAEEASAVEPQVTTDAPPVAEPEPTQILTAAEPIELEAVVDHSAEQIAAPPATVEESAEPIVTTEAEVPLPHQEVPAEPITEQVEVIPAPVDVQPEAREVAETPTVEAVRDTPEPPLAETASDTTAPQAPPAEPAAAEAAIAEPPSGKRKRGARGGRGSRKKNVEATPATIIEGSPAIIEGAPASPPARRRSRKKSPEQEPQARLEVSPSQDMTVEAPPAEQEPRSANLSVAGEELSAPASLATEVLEPTEPTLESALDLAPALEPAPAEAEQVPTGNTADAGLTDSAFGQVVQDFAGSGLGPLVEEPVAANEEPVEAVEVPAPQADLELQSVNEPPSAPTSEAVSEPPAPEDVEPNFELPEPDLAIDLAETPAEHAVGFEADERQEPVAQPQVAPEPPAVTSGEHDEPHNIEPASNTMASALDDSMSSTESIAPSRQRLLEPSQDEHAAPDLAEISAAPPTELEPPPQLTAPPEAEQPPESQSKDQSPQQPAQEIPSPIQERPAVPTPRPPLDPFFGMSRDLASFIGGMPLTLTSTAPLPPAPAPRVPAPSPLPPPSAPMKAPDNSAEKLVFSNDDAEQFPPLDLTLPDETSLDLFEKAGEKVDQIPDQVESLGDVSETVHPAAAMPPPPPVAPPAPVAPPPRPALSQVAPPPPPRTSPLRSFTTSPQPAAPPSNLSMTPPPFGGVPQQRITMPAVRQVDVFSNIAFPPLDPSMFGAPQRPAFPPARVQSPAPQHTEEPAEDLENQIQAARPMRREAALPNRQLPAVASTAVLEAPAAPQRPWWKSLRFLLPLMILAILLVIVVVMFFPPRHIVQGSLQLQGAGDNQNIAAHQQLVRLRKLVGTARVRQLALENLRQQNLDPGFVSDPDALESLSDPRNSPFDEARNELVLAHASRDIDGDKSRMRALLAALYAESGSVNDQSARDRQELDRKQAELQALQGEQAARQGAIQKLTEQIASSGGNSGQAAIVNPLISLQQGQQNDPQLQRALVDAAQTAEARRQELRRIQSKALLSDSQSLAQFNEIAQTIADWSARLNALVAAQQTRVEQAAANFNKSLDDFDRQLAAFPLGADQSKIDSTLSPYLLLARGEVANIRLLSQQSLAVSKQNASMVAQLRRQIAERREAHLRQVWSDDASLQQLLEERGATSAGAILQSLDQKIDARRSALATGDPGADQVSQKLYQAMTSVQADLQANERQLRSKLQLLSPPAFEELPVPMQQAAANLSRVISGLVASRDGYASAALLGGEAAREADNLQSQIAAQQARLDTFRMPRPDPQVQRALLDLDAAQTAQANAAIAYSANHAILVPLRQFAALTASDDSQEKLAQKQREVDDLRSLVASSPLVLKPDDNAISVALTPDRRFPYLIAGIVAVLLLFAGPLWKSLGKPHVDIPYAAPLVEGYDVPGSPLHSTELARPEFNEGVEHDPLAPDPFEDEHPAPA